jgi:hypoxanthine phosphoribosyltransferase
MFFGILPAILYLWQWRIRSWIKRHDRFAATLGLGCNALVLDDLFDSGASMEAACTVLRTYAKIDKIFIAAFTWK